MENEEIRPKEQWLEKLAFEYDGILPYRNETEIVLWLKKKAAEAKNSEESKNYNALIDEAENFGSRDDWGTLDSGMVRFSEFLKLLRARAQCELP